MNSQIHSNRDVFTIFFAVAFILVIAFSAYNYVNRPQCENGFLMQDASGQFRCMDKNSPVIVIQNQRYPGFRRRF